jgi:hypothetical protein
MERYGSLMIPRAERTMFASRVARPCLPLPSPQLQQNFPDPLDFPVYASLSQDSHAPSSMANYSILLDKNELQLAIVPGSPKLLMQGTPIGRDYHCSPLLLSLSR